MGLVLSELGLPIPETPIVIAVGIVSERMGLPLFVPILGCCLAVMIGDLWLYYSARAFGVAALERRPLRWVLPARVLPRIDALFERHGAMAIFVARFISGVRLATFVLAGMRRMPILRFVLWDGLAIVITVPVFAGLGHLFATRAENLERHVARANHLVLAILVLAVVAYGAFVVLRWRGRVRRERAES